MITATTTTTVLNADLQAIIDAPLPSVRKVGLRGNRKETAASIRSLFRSLGLKGIGVKTPNYSMARVIDITLPRNDPEPTVPDPDFPGYTTHHPAYRAQRNAALARIRAIVLAAFSDLDDRSDLMADYFDDPLSIS